MPIYSIADDFPSQDVDLTTLYRAIEQSGIVTPLAGISVPDGANVHVEFDPPLTGTERLTMDAIVAGHTGTPEIGQVALDGEVGVDRAPTEDDDESKGFRVGSRWIHDGYDEYVCINATIGAAVWKRTTIPERYSTPLSSPFIHTSNSAREASFVEANVVGGRYEIAWFYEWAADTTSSDFIGEIRMDGDVISLHRQEPKDSSGSQSGDDDDDEDELTSGTDQRHVAHGFWEVDLTPGTHRLSLHTKASQSGVEVTVYRAILKIMRIG